MFNIMVTGGEGYWERKEYTWPIARVFEYTSDSYRKKFSDLDEDTIEQLKKIPTLFMYENYTDADAKIGYITSIRRYGSDLKIFFEFDSSLPAIPPKNITRIKSELQLEDFEFSRTHWAIKDGDLLEILRDAEIIRPKRWIFPFLEDPSSNKAPLFKSMHLKNWRHIAEISINFHPRLTVITGANGAGKTTVLNLINKHYGWDVKFVSSPLSQAGNKILNKLIKYVSGVFGNSLETGATEQIIGSFVYTGIKDPSPIKVPVEVSSTFAPIIERPNEVAGMHIPSHRPIFSYQHVSSIPTEPRSSIEAFNNYISHNRARYHDQGGSAGPTYHLKEALLSMNIWGLGNRTINPDQEALKNYQGFEDLLYEVLPKKLGYQGLLISKPEVLLRTNTGDFALDAVSGGIASIIDISWQIYMFAQSQKGLPFAVTLDEPENHLHPELQQSFLPSIVSAFPQAQFIVATHSPLIISSVPESYIYAFSFNEGHKVQSVQLDRSDKAGTSNDILREILGLEFTSALWVNERLQSIIAQYRQRDISDETFADLRKDLIANGLEQYAPQTIARIVE